jgi:hypothetical protein
MTQDDMPGSKPGDLVRLCDERKGLEMVSAFILKEGIAPEWASRRADHADDRK